MKKYATLFLPLLTSGLLTACATTSEPEIANKPSVIQEHDIQRLAQQGYARALDARTQQTNRAGALAGVDTQPTIERTNLNKPRALAGAPPPSRSPKKTNT
jgi:hypothetical protein